MQNKDILMNSKLDRVIYQQCILHPHPTPTASISVHYWFHSLSRI